MGGGSQRRRIRLGSIGAVSLVLSGLLLALLPVGSAASIHPMQITGPGSGGPGVLATVYFNGQPIASHTTTGSAISTTFSPAFTVSFFINISAGTGLATSITISGVRVSMLYFGANIAQKEVDIQNPIPGKGANITFPMDLTQYQYLISGLYAMDAIVLVNGTAASTQQFFIAVHPPYYLTVVSVALIGLGLFEIYSIAALGSTKAAARDLGLAPPKGKHSGGGGGT